MEEGKFGLSELETKLVAGCHDEALTRQRMRQVVLVAIVFVALLVVVTWYSESVLVVLGLALLYIAITTWEKLAYGRAVLAYKSIIRKLMARLEKPG